MAPAPDDLTEVQLCRARNTLRREVETLLDGSGLKIRELANELVITNPQDPDKGQIHVAYADGYVSWQRRTWEYWGHIESRADGSEAEVTAEKIISTLAIRM